MDSLVFLVVAKSLAVTHFNFRDVVVLNTNARSLNFLAQLKFSGPRENLRYIMEVDVFATQIGLI